MKEYLKHELVKPDNSPNFYLPYKLKMDLDIFVDDMIHSEMDIVIVIDGKEGTGKSRTGRIVGKYISERTKVPFNHNNIHFTTKDYLEFSESHPKYTINVMDESRQAIAKKRTMSRDVQMFTNWLSENRDKQQVHILLLPAVHDLDSYITMWRMCLLVHHLKSHKANAERVSGYELDRGAFRTYQVDKDLQRTIFNRAKYGYYAYPCNPKYEGKVKDFEPFSKAELEAYNEKKAGKRKEKYTEPEKEDKRLTQAKKLAAELSRRGVTQAEIGRLIDMDNSTISKWIKEVET